MDAGVASTGDLKEVVVVVVQDTSISDVDVFLIAGNTGKTALTKPLDRLENVGLIGESMLDCSTPSIRLELC